MTENYEPVTGDEYWYRQGRTKCVCNHWNFQHETTLLSVFSEKTGGFCHEYTCQHFKYVDKNAQRSRS